MKTRFQNKSARLISNVKPGGVIDLDEEQADWLRGSACFRAEEMIELGSQDDPEAALPEPEKMPKPRIPDLSKAKQGPAIAMIRDETSIAILEAWWKAEMAGENRTRILDEIKLRAESLAPKNAQP